MELKMMRINGIPHPFEFKDEVPVQVGELNLGNQKSGTVKNMKRVLADTKVYIMQQKKKTLGIEC